MLIKCTVTQCWWNKLNLLEKQNANDGQKSVNPTMVSVKIMSDYINISVAVISRKLH